MIDQKTPRSWFWGGLLVGLPFLARLQMLAWPAGMFLVLLFRKPGLRLIRSAALGFAVPVLFQGLLDWATWGAPFHSVIMNVKKTVADIKPGDFIASGGTRGPDLELLPMLCIIDWSHE